MGKAFIIRAPGSFVLLRCRTAYFRASASVHQSDKLSPPSAVLSYLICSKHVKPILERSLFILFFHVNLGAPLAIFRGLSYSCITCLMGVLCGNLITCPYNLSHLLAIVVLHGVSPVFLYKSVTYLFRPLDVYGVS